MKPKTGLWKKIIDIYDVDRHQCKNLQINYLMLI